MFRLINLIVKHAVNVHIVRVPKHTNKMIEMDLLCASLKQFVGFGTERPTRIRSPQNYRKTDGCLRHASV